MNRSKNGRNAVAAGLLLAASCANTWAQPQLPDQLLRGVLDAVTQAQGRGRDRASPSVPVTAADMMGGIVTSTAIPQNVLYPSRQQLLEAAQHGELAGLDRAEPEEKKRFVDSVHHIFAVEYQISPISKECAQHWFPSDVYGLLSRIAQAKVSTLNDQPPEFTTPANYQRTIIESIDGRLADLQNPRDATVCDSRAMGRAVPHPYKAALVSLAGDFAKATQIYVDAQRSRRKAQYEGVLAQDRQRKAQAQAAQQQRIDAEAARIRADEQRRANKEKARVGG